MTFPKLTFPVSVDFGGDGYWIGSQGPFKYGAAVTALFIGENISEVDNDALPLMRELEVCLKTFGNYLHPYARAEKVPDELFHQLEQSSAGCSVNYAFHPLQGSVTLVERYTFSSLRDFLYVELGKAILRGNAPRQCRLCGRWFLHEQGGRAMYCERVAPGEEDKTCREAGARAVFEKKIQDEDTWKIYKRAYKKYYARVMKGNMNREDFDTWVEQAAADRDAVIEQIKPGIDAALKAQIIERLREKLNRQ